MSVLLHVMFTNNAFTRVWMFIRCPVGKVVSQLPFVTERRRGCNISEHILAIGRYFVLLILITKQKKSVSETLVYRIKETFGEKNINLDLMQNFLTEKFF